MSQPSFIQVDWQSFDPWKIQQVSHTLASHPLLTLEQLAALGKRLEDRDCVRTHSNDVTAGTPFNDAPSLHPNRKSAAQTLTQIAEAKAWMSLLNVQTDPTYQVLIDEVLEQLRPQIEVRDPGMSYRAGWIFITSPKTITPFHIDKEHNFILQIQGTKKLYVWSHEDRHVVSEAARDLFHKKHSRERIKWDDSFKSRARVFNLVPGMGAYMPSTSPHMVENDDGPSVTISFTYYTDATRRNSLLHRTHETLRTIGVEPSPVGSKPVIDAVLSAAGGIVASKGQEKERFAPAKIG